MFVELAESLRCPLPHAETWLVLGAHRMDGRHVIAGVLGCPACGAEYRIVEGIPRFGTAVAAEGGTGAAAAPGVGDSSGGGPPDGTEVARAGALLNLIGEGGLVLLTGGWRALAAALFDLVPAQYVLLDAAPAPPSGRDAREGISVVAAAGVVPFGTGSLRAAALEEPWIAPELIARTLRSLRPHARLVLPAGAALPADVRELAADSRHRVMEVAVASSAPVQLEGRGKREGGRG